MYDNVIRINTGKIPKIEEMDKIIENRFKDNAAELGIIIGKNYKYRLKNKIYTCYIDNDFLFLKFICDRGSFRNDINKKGVLCKIAENGKANVVNECTKLNELRNNTIKKLVKNDANLNKDKTLLEYIE